MEMKNGLEKLLNKFYNLKKLSKRKLLVKISLSLLSSQNTARMTLKELWRNL